MSIKTKIDEESMTITIRVSECCARTIIKGRSLKTEKARKKALNKATGCCRKVLKKQFKLMAEEEAEASVKH